ncbi:hypothetical protein CB1_000661002 [Camelus ferus]|nr:hypothetical protein CB1_000661002 [Camelus ferus]
MRAGAVRCLAVSMATKSVAWWSPSEKMKLKSLLLRYYPPGIMLEYENSGELKTKSIDLLDLDPRLLGGHLREVKNDNSIFGSYDRTCKLWDTASGEELHTLEGHRNVVYAIAFNNPYGKVCTLIGHCAEISSALFNWDCSLILTGSMDKTCMLWDATNGRCVATLTGHDDEILDSCFDYTGKLIATASADGK